MPGPTPSHQPRNGNGHGNGHHGNRGSGPGGMGDGIPLSFGSFVGRSSDRDNLIAALTHERLVTLCGPPGVGKTRLAAEAAAAVAAGYGDGARWFDLAALSEPEALVPTFAQALRLQEQPGTPLIETVARFVADRRMLFVLDNCEHLHAAAGVAARALLQSGSGVTILATSRQALGVAGERRWPVLPLSVPDTNAVAVVAGSEAGRLFCTRATVANAEFALGPESAAAVGDICRRLDGIPLAIELAAARVGVLSASEIAARLDDRFRLLRGGSKAARHQTLAAALDWSYDSLSPAEKALFRRLGTFSGSTAFDSVEAVCAGPELATEAVLDTLASLVSKSMVVARTNPAPARYRLLESLRAYARERLVETGEAEAAQDRHGRWFAGMVALAETYLTGAEQVGWLGRLDADYANVRAAFRFAQSRPDDTALRLASSLALYWRLRGQYGEGWRWIEAARQRCPTDDPALEAKSLWSSGFLAVMVSDWPVAEAQLAQSLGHYRRLGDVGGQARCHLLTGNCRMASGDPATAMKLLEQSATMARDVADDWCEAHARGLAARVRMSIGDAAGARELLDRGLEVSRRASDAQGLRMLLVLLGQLALTEARFLEAGQWLDEALAVSSRLGEPYGQAASLDLLGQVAMGLGDYSRADTLYTDALALARATGSAIAVADGLCRLGLLALNQGDLRRAGDYFRQAENVASNGSPEVRLCLGELALADAELGPARASFDDALARAEGQGLHAASARALYLLGLVERAEGHWAQSEARHRRALDLRSSGGDVVGTVESLEAIGGLAAETGDGERAARLLGAAQTEREAGGFVRTPRHEASHRVDVERARALLGADAFESAWAAGRALTLSEAALYGLRGKGRRGGRPSTGWDSLTRAEREVALLVGDGLTNPQIGERLFVSRETVKGHVGSVLSKLGLSSRIEVAKEVARRQATGRPPPS